MGLACWVFVWNQFGADLDGENDVLLAVGMPRLLDAGEACFSQAPCFATSTVLNNAT